MVCEQCSENVTLPDGSHTVKMTLRDGEECHNCGDKSPKKILRIQTRKQFEKENYNSWRYYEDNKKSNIEKSKKRIDELKTKIEKERVSIANSKPLSFKEYCNQNNYEDWVRHIRETDSEKYTIIENQDSKGVN